jgi:DNA-binding NarL/FixJ family response regulator
MNTLTEVVRAKVQATSLAGVDVRASLVAGGIEVADDGADVVVVVLDRAEDPGAALTALSGGAPVVVAGDGLSHKALWKLIDQGIHGVVGLESPGALVAAVLGAASGLMTIPFDVYADRRRPVLSRREKQVLGLVVLGLTNGEIAQKLHVTEATVKTHLGSCFSKLGVRSRNEATALILDPANRLGTGILSITDGAKGDA